ncbi:FtsK/SpoIIIE domain-containing protein [Sporomusa sphaeroides]|uniref:DNA translocase SpoIIIE n=1 Tax=Sporomusa sphaeroides DSM 2875 TaxID=1337886 RepID=A0ABP2C4Z6_9FIRM|nr:FtsK/SpoIIIE domain-containing protein [Sporomusa sphaeroides]OLS56334.1 DNA translocase SpoIIIE [Sporomusa sphaeroides DSM 2875]CVK18429.1 DNA translocase SpoIIIE [Sporomusa sphaeroides DSM 2875]
MDILTEIKNDVRSILLPMFGQEIPLAVIETLEALWTDTRRPQIHVKNKTATGYTFTIALPAGISFKDFYSKIDYFKDATGGDKVNAEIRQSGKMAILKISNNLLENYFDYPADYPRAGVLPVPLGYSTAGLQVIDLAKLPHMLIGGTTGAGKSNAVHVIINSLLSLPEPPIVVMLDLKMSEYNYLENRILLVTEIETACQALNRLVQEMRRRQLLLKESRFVNVQKYNAKTKAKIPYIVLIIDELAELKDKDAQEDLETLLRLCRAAGICIVAATQRPSSKIFTSKSFGDAKANFTGRLCFQTISGVDSRIILDSSEGANLPAIPGRAYWRLGRELTEIQTPYLDPEEVMCVDQFQASMLPKGFTTAGDTFGMGRTGYGAATDIAVPVNPGSTAKAGRARRSGRDKP